MAGEPLSASKILMFSLIGGVLAAALIMLLSLPSEKETLDASAFAGINRPDSQTLLALFPESAGEPMLIEFTSRYCIDCKRLAPLLKGIIQDYPQVRTHIFDVQADRKANASVFEAFRPMVVPAVILVHPDGTISHTFLEVADEAALRTALDTISNNAL